MDRFIFFAFLISTVVHTGIASECDDPEDGTCGADVESLLQTRVKTDENKRDREDNMVKAGIHSGMLIQLVGSGGEHGKCLDAEANHEVVMWDCNTLYLTQRWEYNLNTYRLESLRNPGYCLHKQQVSSNGAAVGLAACSTSANQKWYYEGLQLTNHYGFCLDSYYHSTNGHAVQMWACASEVATSRRRYSSGGRSMYQAFYMSQLSSRLQYIHGGTNGWHGCNSTHRCGACEGDCDRDSDCHTGHRCKQRNAREDVAGCDAGGRGDHSSTDYCYNEEACSASIINALCSCVSSSLNCRRIRDGTCQTHDTMQCLTHLWTCTNNVPELCRDQCSFYLSTKAASCTGFEANLNLGGGSPLPPGYAMLEGEANQSVEDASEARETKSEGSEDSLDESLSGKRTCE